MVKISPFVMCFCYIFSFKYNFRMNKKLFIGASGGITSPSRNEFLGAGGGITGPKSPILEAGDASTRP